MPKENSFEIRLRISSWLSAGPDLGPGAPGKQSGGLFSAKGGRQPREERRGREAKRQPCGLFAEGESEAKA